MLGLKLNHVSKRGHRPPITVVNLGQFAIPDTWKIEPVFCTIVFAMPTRSVEFTGYLLNEIKNSRRILKSTE